MTHSENVEDTVIANPNATDNINDTDHDNHDIGEQKKETDTAPNTPEQRSLLTRLSGIGFMTVSSVTATAQGVALQYLSHFPTGEALAIFSALAAALLSVMITFKGDSFAVPRKLMPLFLVKNVVTMITFSAKTWAFQNIPLGDASALIFTMPLWTGIFSRIFLKEKYTIAQLFCTIVGFSGVILVAKPTFIFGSDEEVTSAEKEENPGWYPLIALLSGISMATEFTMQKGLGDTISSMVITFYMMVFHVAAGLILHHAMREVYLNPVCYLSRGLLLIASLHPVIGLSCLMRGLAVESASTSTLVKNLDTVLAFIVQVAVFGDPIDKLSIGGAALIITGTITLTLARMFDITCGIEL